MFILKASTLSICLFSFLGCTTNYPTTIGTIGGAVTGAGVGAIVARNSSKISNLQGVGFGALIGIPVGIAVVHGIDEYGRYSVLTSNNDTIENNYLTIISNQNYIDEQKIQVLLESPRGNVNPDFAEYIYLGPTMGTPWR